MRGDPSPPRDPWTAFGGGLRRRIVFHERGGEAEGCSSAYCQTRGPPGSLWFLWDKWKMTTGPVREPLPNPLPPPVTAVSAVRGGGGFARGPGPCSRSGGRKAPRGHWGSGRAAAAGTPESRSAPGTAAKRCLRNDRRGNDGIHAGLDMAMTPLDPAGRRRPCGRGGRPPRAQVRHGGPWGPSGFPQAAVYGAAQSSSAAGPTGPAGGGEGTPGKRGLLASPCRSIAEGALPPAGKSGRLMVIANNMSGHDGVSQRNTSCHLMLPPERKWKKHMRRKKPPQTCISHHAHTNMSTHIPQTRNPPPGSFTTEALAKSLLAVLGCPLLRVL